MTSRYVVGDRVRIKHTRSIRRVVEVDGDGARLVTVEGSPLAAGGEGGWYYADQLEKVPGGEESEMPRVGKSMDRKAASRRQREVVAELTPAPPPPQRPP